MIYLKNIREKQTVYIPRTDINGKVVAVKSYDEGYADGKEEGKKLQKLKLTNLTVSENGVYKREDGWNEVNIDVKPSLQSKTINVTKDVEIVMADDAFDGLSKVNVNATQYGKNKRNEGYNQGYLEGEDYGYKFGYTEGKTEGYNQGKNDGIVEGYADGKTDGINEQKSKLESITITENGTYTKEDGYNSISVNIEDLNGDYDEGYNAGYDDGLTNAGKTAQVLNITENGIYTTKYSEPNEANAQVTGYFDDNTPFYGYTHLTNHTIATGIIPTKTSKVELWWRPDFNGSGFIFANTSVVLNGIYLKVDGGKFSVKFGNYTKNNQLEVEDKWYHIVVSTDGLVIDGETITTLGTPSMFMPGTGLFINGDGVTTIGNVCANGYFGMVKIDGKTFIPTEDGFIDYTTDTILTVYKEGEYDYEKPTYDGNLIRTIRVSVAGGSADGYDDGYNAGYFVGQTEGYNAGKTDGASEQKSKLESISITENGTYTKEDGYNSIVVKVPDVNGSYDEGYTEGKTDGYADGKKDGYSEGYEVGKSECESVNLVELNHTPTMYDALPAYKLNYTPSKYNADGFSKVSINITNIYGTGYNEGYAEGKKILKINVQNEGLKLSNSTFTEVPDWVDWSGITNITFMFEGCGNLTTIPMIDTSKVTSMSHTFHNCISITTIPLWDTSKVTDMYHTFYKCDRLKNIPQLNTSNVTNMTGMFRDCTNITSIPALNASNVTYISNFFGSFGVEKLTDVGGLIGLKKSMGDAFGFAQAPNLSYQSCINILNGLYDFTGNGETPSSSPDNLQGKLMVHQNFLDKVGDKISIGINKGWTITA